MGIQLNGTSGTDTISAIDGTLTVDGVITATDKLSVGAAVTSNVSGINVTGIVTATSFSGSGANLTNLPVTVGLSTNAQENTYGGHSAGAALQSGGQNNTLIGKQAGTAISTGDRNTAIGEQALKLLSTGGENTAVGALAGFNATGSDGVFIGQGAGYGGGAGFSGDKNIAIGKNTLVSATSNTGCTVIGWYAGNAITNNLSTFIGHQAGKNATAGACVAIGADTMVANATAAGTVAIGFETLTALTSGQYNVVAGYEAARTLTSGHSNIGLGYRVLNSSNSSYNIAIGTQALHGLTNGGQSVAIGHESGYTCQTGSQNVSIGYNALKLGTASHNTIVGAFAGDAITSGEGNVALGRNALSSLQGGHNNIAIGRGATASSTSVSNEITLGDTSITKFRIPGINFVVKDNGGTPSSGQVLTADSSGEASWTSLINPNNVTAPTNASEYIWTGIPSTAREITFTWYNIIPPSNGNNLWVQVGNSSGIVGAGSYGTISGYILSGNQSNGTATHNGASSGAKFMLGQDWSNTNNKRYGTLVLRKHNDSANMWIGTGNYWINDSTDWVRSWGYVNGYVICSNLDRFRVYHSAGGNFSAGGTFNCYWQ